MSITHRAYLYPHYYGSIYNFLTEIYLPDRPLGNWLPQRWEYGYYHSYFDHSASSKIGVWEDSDAIVSVATYESTLGEAFFQVRPGYEHLKPAMLRYAEDNLSAPGEDGRQKLRVFACDLDDPLKQLLSANGYTKRDSKPHWESRMAISPAILGEPGGGYALPEGYRVASLAEDNDYSKINRVLWRGFNHEGEPAEDAIDGRRLSQMTPNFRKDLTMAVIAPNGDYASFAGTWFDPVHRYAFVEPVATDPAYRRMGLGTVAVMEGIRRCGRLGATVAWVGSGQPFYEEMGFKKIYADYAWEKQS